MMMVMGTLSSAFVNFITLPTTSKVMEPPLPKLKPKSRRKAITKIMKQCNSENVSIGTIYILPYGCII